jgi:hypothetical protein
MFHVQEEAGFVYLQEAEATFRQGVREHGDVAAAAAAAETRFFAQVQRAARGSSLSHLLSS